MNYLVIGGAGFLGANLVRRLLQESHANVAVVDSLEPALHATTDTLRAVWDQITFIRGDLRDETLLAEVVQGKHVIFNCAAQTSHPLSIQYPLLDAEINCLGNLKLLESMRLLNPSATVVYAGSSTVVGKAIHPVVDESHPERPLDIYSANKGVAEKYYRIYHAVHDLKTVCLRFGNLYGPYGKGYPVFGFVNYFISLAWSKKPITVYGTGGQTRNVTFVEDAVEAMLAASQSQAVIGETHFATSDVHLSVHDIAESIVRVLGRGSVESIEWPEERKRMEIDDVRLSSERFRSITGWKPQFDFACGMCRTKEILQREEALILR